MIDAGIDLRSRSDEEVFLIHGYTGSQTDFNELPNYLHERLNLNVKAILLKGHGTSIGDLDALGYDDFLNQAETALKAEIRGGKKIVIVGVSFGAQLALILASKYPVMGVITVSIPYSLRFPFNIPLIETVGVFKKHWRKFHTPLETRLRKHARFYSHMHINGLKIVKQSNKILEDSLKDITCPSLAIHSTHDPISDSEGIVRLQRVIGSGIKQSVVFRNRNHNIFYSSSRRRLYRLIATFIRDAFEIRAAQKETVAAIVPAYNEAESIGEVLEALSKTECIDEIIVVDDASTDGTDDVVRRFEGVVLLKNRVNMGKSHSMQRGVDASEAPIIFFCDADLHGLSPEIIRGIVAPVRRRSVDMFIGIRSNLMQRSFLPFALNSGERALRRETWNALPSRFKKRYRVEVGLNHLARHLGKGYDYRVFDYRQTLKEKKYGLLKGTFLRWWMNFDVGMAYLLVLLDLMRGGRLSGRSK